jgi:cytochrome P450
VTSHPYPGEPAADPITNTDEIRLDGELAASVPFFWSARHSCWVASQSASVDAVLSDAHCAVRPPDEPIPPALAGTTTGVVFGNLARMTDGEVHHGRKRAIERALSHVSEETIYTETAHWATYLPVDSDLSRFGANVSIHVLGHLLGIPAEQLAATSSQVHAFARCLAPAASSEQITAGVDAAENLWSLIAGRLSTAEPSTLLAMLRDEMLAEDEDDLAVIANAIGLLFQACDAMAGLIGNTVVELSRPDHHSHIVHGQRIRTIDEIVEYVLIHEAPIQNTRRWATDDTTIGNQTVRAGEMVLVALAAANLDPVVAVPVLWSFGQGAHACPGQTIARNIAAGCIEMLLERGVIPFQLPCPLTYEPSSNARIPILETWSGDDHRGGNA